MTWPTFLIIGTAKAGTTALYHYLMQHPQIYMSPNKEPNYFALTGERLDFRGPADMQHIGKYSVTDSVRYTRLFEGANGAAAIGEASPLYLYDPRAPARIHETLPDVKLIVILRNPVERAYSSFLHLVRDQREPILDFEQALQAEQARIEANWEHIWHYVQLGFYHRQLQRYLQIFDRRQLLILLYEDWNADNAATLRQVFHFLGVEDHPVQPPNRRPNDSTNPRRWPLHKHKRLHRFISSDHALKRAVRWALPPRTRRHLGDWIGRRNMRVPPLTARARAFLVATYREDVHHLQRLIARDVSTWLTV